MNKQLMSVLTYALMQIGQVFALALAGKTSLADVSGLEWILMALSAALAALGTLHAYFNQGAPAVAMSATASKILMLPTNVPSGASRNTTVAVDPPVAGRSVPPDGTSSGGWIEVVGIALILCLGAFALSLVATVASWFYPRWLLAAWILAGVAIACFSVAVVTFALCAWQDARECDHSATGLAEKHNKKEMGT